MKKPTKKTIPISSLFVNPDNPRFESVKNQQEDIELMLDEKGEIYNVHITDGLNSYGTWEYIDFKFTLPHSYYILIWRRDKKKFNKENALVTKYIRDDLRDFIEEGRINGSNWHNKIIQKLVDSNSCLVLVWDTIILPEPYLLWKNFCDDVSEIVKKESKEIVKPGSSHEQELAIYEGKMILEEQNNPIYKSFAARSKKFPSFKIPTDEVIQQYVIEMLLESVSERA